MSFEDWLVFMAIWIAASIPLGPNAVNCIASSATNGFSRGLWSVFGVFLAANIHMTLAVTGIAAFLSANLVFFEILRWVGVAYLAWMGVSMFRSTGELNIAKPTQRQAPRLLVRRAILISLGNPKAIFAWIAVFSQFIDAARPLGPQLFVLAPSALSVTIVVYGAYSALGLGVNRVFAGRRKRWFDRGTGVTYIAFALGLASSDLRRT